jgi:hypothetical protein
MNFMISTSEYEASFRSLRRGSNSVTRATGPAILAVALATATPSLSKDDEAPDDPMASFVLGEYAVVGQKPGGGQAYVGSARIEEADGGLILTRRVGEQEVSAAGRFEVPSPPGEGRVLRFRWKDPEAMLMTCLVGSDLDNYARLTCVWLREGTRPSKPGLEAMFATAAWPKPQP